MFERIILPDGMLPPMGPFPHAIRAGDFLFVTGQLAEDPITGNLVKSPIDQQVRQVMDNLKLILDQAGASFEKVVMARIFLTDIRYIETVNKVYSTYFKNGQLPCRTTIGVTGLAGLGDVEIDLIVYCSDKS